MSVKAILLSLLLTGTEATPPLMESGPKISYSYVIKERFKLDICVMLECAGKLLNILKNDPRSALR